MTTRRPNGDSAASVRDKRIDIIAALTKRMGIRAAARLSGVNRETVGNLALGVGRGELHERIGVESGHYPLSCQDRNETNRTHFARVESVCSRRVLPRAARLRPNRTT